MALVDRRGGSVTTLAKHRSEGALGVSGRRPGGQSRALATVQSVPNLQLGMSRLACSGRLLAQGYWGSGPPRTRVYQKDLDKRVFTKSKVFEADTSPVTDFRRHFERGDIPIVVKHGAKCGLEWKVEPDKLDYMHYLPMFFDGVFDKTPPYSFLAVAGVYDMLAAGRNRVLPVIPQLIVPIRRCLNSKDTEIVCKMLNILQVLVQCDDRIGEALVPYYRQILPVFNMFKSKNMNLGDKMEYSQQKRQNMGDLIQETLNLFERYGGEDAFINIKYMIPTYESFVQ